MGKKKETTTFENLKAALYPNPEIEKVVLQLVKITFKGPFA